MHFFAAIVIIFFSVAATSHLIDAHAFHYSIIIDVISPLLPMPFHAFSSRRFFLAIWHPVMA